MSHDEILDLKDENAEMLSACKLFKTWIMGSKNLIIYCGKLMKRFLMLLLPSKLIKTNKEILCV